MDEYYTDLKKAIAALENYVASLEKDEYNYLYSSLERITDIQKNFRP